MDPAITAVKEEGIGDKGRILWMDITVNYQGEIDQSGSRSVSHLHTLSLSLVLSLFIARSLSLSIYISKGCITEW